MSIILYNLFIVLYKLGISIASLFNNKARLWISGRKNIFNKLQAAIQNKNEPIVWVHCASLGEFEQGRPIIESIKKDYPQYKILLTFFSPSGYEVQKKYAQADYIFYLPMDSALNAKKFISIVQPKLVVFVKYEFWYYYLAEIKKQNIPLLLVSGIFRDDQPFFKWYGSLHKKMLQSFTHFFVQTNDAAALLANIHITNVSASGDTRFDRVLDIASHMHAIIPIENFCKGHHVIVAGSTWSTDDEELDHYANTHNDYRFIIAPHDIGKERIDECLQLYKHAILYSDFIALSDEEQTTAANFNTIIINNIGMLKRLYHYATICYVGGGFGGDGVHNVLEAAVYNKPVVFGPVYEKYIEAVELVDAEAAFTVDDALELEEQLNELITDTDLYKKACENAGNYVKKKTGATQSIMTYIQTKRLLTT